MNTSGVFNTQVSQGIDTGGKWHFPKKMLVLDIEKKKPVKCM
jgi:hypothetical protein